MALSQNEYRTAERLKNPDAGDWRSWEALMASREFAEGGSAYDAMTIAGDDGFATLSSALIALPASGSQHKPLWRSAAGRPDITPYESISA